MLNEYYAAIPEHPVGVHESIVCPLNLTISVALVTVPLPTTEGVHCLLGQLLLRSTELGFNVADKL